MKHLLFLGCMGLMACGTQPNTPPEGEPVTEVVTLSDSALQAQLEWMAVEDQTLRKLLPAVTEQFGRESEESRYVWSLINRQDSICIAKITHLVDNYGWLGKSRVGTKANQAIWLIVQHAELSTQERYLPLLEESVQQGESEGWHLAYLQDRILMYKEQDQLYGTQALWDDSLQQFKIYPIADVENVNQRRLELGLDSIEVHAATHGYVFDQSY